ncbi:MAG: dihydropteroate synthase [Treponema sp.]|nr:dihydropteroate synthase [Treponema sp.]
MLSLKFGNKKITSDRPAFVMGILNVTEDSFWEKSRGGIERAFEIINSGAEIIDIGAESTRPGYKAVDPKEQISRLIPVIKAIREKSDIVISIDTRDSQVFKECLAAGADVLNDVSSLESDKNMLPVLKASSASVILMHGFGLDENHPSDKNIVKKVNDYLLSRARFLEENGIDSEKIIFDPGIGFGKTFEENIALIKNSKLLAEGKYPLLMALSRKRCIGGLMQRENTAADRLSSTLTANILSVQISSKIVRVHDVQETIDALNVMKYLE